MTTGKCLKSIEHKEWVRNVSFNSSGTCLVTASDDKTAILYDIAADLEK